MSKVVENTFIDENNENSLINENDENEEYQKNLAIFEDVYLPYKKYQDIIKEIQSLNNLIPSLKYDKQKDSDKVEKKILHLLNLYRELNNNYNIFISKSIIEIRKNNKLEKKKKKENKDKSKYYVNIPKNSPKFILEMMNKSEDELVSQSQVLTALIQKIKKCSESNPTNYAVFKETGKIDKTKFRIYGDLKIFFDEIKKEAMNRGNDVIIPEVMGYPNLMSYMQYFVYKNIV